LATPSTTLSTLAPGEEVVRTEYIGVTTKGREFHERD
jgi:hypothetical protein